MGRKKKLKIKVPKLNLWYNTKKNLKWTIGLIVFIIIAMFLVFPPYLWLQTDWFLYIPPIVFLSYLVIPVLALIFVATVLRLLYLMYKSYA